MARTGVVLLASFVLAAAAGGAAAATSYPDPTGDVRGGAGPDVVSITLSHTTTMLTFRVRFAAAPPLRMSAAKGWVDMLLLEIDVPPLGPKPGMTGWRGADYALGTHGPSKTGMLVRLAKNQSHRVATFRIVAAGATLRFSIARRALGSPAWFAFSTAAAREMEAAGGGVDLAPARGTFRYTFRG